MIRIHLHPRSTYSRRVRIALIEKNIPHETVVVDMVNGEHRRPEYRALNPYGRVPVLEHDGFVLYESTAILGYLEATNPTPPLLPADAKGRALVDMHVKLCDLQMTRQTGAIIFPKRFLPKERWDQEAMIRAKAEIEKHLEIIDRCLVGKQYLVADRYSLADVSYVPFLEFLPLMEISPPPAIAAWAARLLARPSSVITRPIDGVRETVNTKTISH